MTKITLLLALFLGVFGQCTYAAGPVTCDDCSCDTPDVRCIKVCDFCSCDKGWINCSNLKLNASLPNNGDYWPMATAYSKLSLDRNKIGRVVPFPDLLIKTLGLSYNLIVAIDKLAFRKLTALEELDLSHNQITELDPESFEGPYDATQYQPLNIKILNLSYNELTSLHPDVFEHLPFLEKLTLSFNDFGAYFDQRTTTALASLDRLQVLDLTAVGLTTLPETFLLNLSHLRELILDANLFKTLPADQLSYGKSIKILRFDENPIKVLSSQTPFPYLPNLEQLHISSMPELTRIESGSLSGLRNLTYLKCKLNEKLEFISPKAMSSEKIVKLDLHDNALRYLSESLVHDWNQVVHLDIRGNPWSCDCANQWMVDDLMDLMELMGNSSDGLTCKYPEQMKGYNMASMHEKNYNMRCLDYYGNHPEKDSTFLIATFVIVILASVIFGGVWWFKGGWRCRKGRPIDYTAIYQQRVNDDDRF